MSFTQEMAGRFARRAVEVRTGHLVHARNNARLALVDHQTFPVFSSMARHAKFTEKFLANHGFCRIRESRRLLEKPPGFFTTPLPETVYALHSRHRPAPTRPLGSGFPSAGVSPRESSGARLAGSPNRRSLADFARRPSFADAVCFGSGQPLPFPCDGHGLRMLTQSLESGT